MVLRIVKRKTQTHKFALVGFAVLILIINFATSNLQMGMEQENADALNIRLKVFMDSTGLNNSQFADKCGLPRPSFSQILSGRNKKVSDVVLTRIHEAFPSLNMLWLMFGEGDMLKGGNKGASQGEPTDYECGDSAKSPSRHDTIYGDINMGSVADENFMDDNRKFHIDGRGGSEFYRETGPIFPLSERQEVDIERISLLMADKIRGDLANDLKPSPRKVVRITVFYDDNSYETFAPTSEPLG